MDRRTLLRNGLLAGILLPINKVVLAQGTSAGADPYLKYVLSGDTACDSEGGYGILSPAAARCSVAPAAHSRQVRQSRRLDHSGQ